MQARVMTVCCTPAKAGIKADQGKTLMARILIFLFSISVLTGPVGAKEEIAKTQQDENANVALDSSSDMKSGGGVFVTQSLTLSPFGSLNQTGARMRLEGTLGSYKYRNEAPPPPQVHGRSSELSALLGYEVVNEDRFSLAGYVGWNLQRNRLSVLDPENAASGTKTGIRGVLEASYHLTDKLQLEGSASYATANRAYRLDFKGGYDIGSEVLIGPQVILQGDAESNQWKVGAHISGITVGRLELGLGAGYMKDRISGAGFYGLVSTGLRF